MSPNSCLTPAKASNAHEMSEESRSDHKSLMAGPGGDEYHRKDQEHFDLTAAEDPQDPLNWPLWLKVGLQSLRFVAEEYR
jgi:hypothetical protein